MPPTLAKPAARRLTRPLRSGVQPFTGRQLRLWLGMSALEKSADAALIARRRVCVRPDERDGRRSRLGPPQPVATRPLSLRSAAGSSTAFQPCGCICPLDTGLLVARCRPPRPSGPVVFFGQ
jgi:hypothetical protein